MSGLTPAQLPPGWLEGRHWTSADFHLRPLQEADINHLREWRNAQREVLRQDAELSAQQQRRWFREVVTPTHAGENPQFLLVGIESDSRLVAYGGLTNVAWHYRRGEVSFLADTEAARDEDEYSAVFRAFLDWLPQFSFDQLGLHRVFTETWATRESHIALLEGAGFVYEGRMRDHVIKNDRFVDAVLHGLVAHR